MASNPCRSGAAGYCGLCDDPGQMARGGADQGCLGVNRGEATGGVALLGGTGSSVWNKRHSWCVTKAFEEFHV